VTTTTKVTIPIAATLKPATEEPITTENDMRKHLLTAHGLEHGDQVDEIAVADGAALLELHNEDHAMMDAELPVQHDHTTTEETE
jgi:hypothetical protein